MDYRISTMRNYNSSNNTRKCSKCKENLDLSNFSERLKTLKSGEIVINYRESCKECSKKALIAWGRPSREYLKAKHLRNPLRNLLNDARSRAKLSGLEFNIDKTDLKIPEICPLLNIPIEIDNIKTSKSSPSIDRIDNSKGYIKGNVMIISHKANTCKNSLELNELKIFATNILKMIDEKI